MSFLVELARGAYPADALNRFKTTSQFGLDNARAMMWLSQLAYETAHQDKIKDILGSWTMNMRAFVSNDPITGLPPHSACVVVAGGRGATIVTFSGTDPLKIEDWITNFTPALSTSDLHSGFERAVDTVWPVIKPLIENRPSAEQHLFFTGHSLGGALALIAAERAVRELGPRGQAMAVHTFGGPRVGGVTFFNAYTPNLGDRTFRLVHGGDIVATVPPTSNFRHVGQSIQCPSDGSFEGAQITPAQDNKPAFIESIVQDGLADFRAFAAVRFLRRIGPRPLDRLAVLLPRMVRDHIPSNYFRALGIPL
ncbi:triacylglycerol lipase [Bradyrhizobium sp. AZCC 1610]|uniref:lipase family protein n=1 Tax=Bradyrhizobium sp. AZCC 1610 TaxID=3117020 RepID=UPI002FF12CD2